MKNNRLSRGLALIIGAVLSVGVAACGDQTFVDPTRSGSNEPIAPSAVASISISPSTGSVSLGATAQFTALVQDAQGRELTGQVTWSSSSQAVLTIDASGLATGVAEGSSSVTASAGGKSASASVTVSAIPVPPPAQSGPRVGHYAAPNGSSSNDGSYNSPWDLQTALSGAGGRVVAGDTVWLRGGTYVGRYDVSVSGQSGKPIVFRQYPGERATIDGRGTVTGQSTFRVGGQYTTFWGFEITNTQSTRSFSTTGNHERPNVVANYANHTRYINLVVHDGGVAFYNEAPHYDVIIEGCVIYNNGWQAPDRGHGHALYIKANSGPVTLRNNIMFNQFGWGVHLYSNAGSGDINNIRVEGNVSFNNGTISNNSTSANILVGGDARANNDVLTGNMTYYSPGQGGNNVVLGHGTTANGTMEVSNNYFAGGTRVLNIGFWDQASITGNTLIGPDNMVTLTDNSLSGYSWSGTSYSQSAGASQWSFQGSPLSLSSWQSSTGLGSTGSAAGATPTTTKVFVRGSTYERGRANIVVYNWGRQGAASVSLSGLVPAGARYQIHNVLDLYGSPVASGTYSGGSVSIPLRNVSAPAPVGWTAGPSGGTEFNVYVVTLVA